MFFKSKRKLKEEIANLEYQLQCMRNVRDEVMKCNNELANEVENMLSMFPFKLGQTVYDVQLRSAKGRYTKNKASREHSLINEVVVTEDNYFGLVNRYRAQDVYLQLEHAEQYIDAVSIE